MRIFGTTGTFGAKPPVPLLNYSLASCTHRLLVLLKDNTQSNRDEMVGCGTPPLTAVDVLVGHVTGGGPWAVARDQLDSRAYDRISSKVHDVGHVATVSAFGT